MPNIDNPNGLVCIGKLGGGEVHRNEYNKDAASSAIFIGDAVQMEADGNLAVAGVAGPAIGVSEGYVASATAGVVYTVDDPDALFVVQNDGTTSRGVVIGANASILATTGDTTNRRSKQELDTSSLATTNNVLHVLDFYRVPGNATAGSWVRTVVRLNKHQLAHGAGRVGI